MTFGVAAGMRDPNDPDPRYNGLAEGEVVDRDDPRGLGRVRVRVPGLIEPASPWAWPLATLGGGPDRGAWFIPEVGAEVGVLFLHGDPDRPYYVGGHWGINDVLSSVDPDGTGKGDPDIRAIETNGYAIVIDERDGRKSLIIRDKAGGNEIELDGLTRGIAIRATTAITIEALGQVDIDGAIVRVAGRLVLPTGSPIR